MNPTFHLRSLVRAATLAWLCMQATVGAADVPFENQALRGVAEVTIAIEGIEADFERYGLTASELRERVEARLRDYGLPVIDAATAREKPGAAQLLVRVRTNRDQYMMYFYAVSVRLMRKVPLDTTGTSFTAGEVWSEGQHGILNPSDLKSIYGYVDTLLGQFIGAHARDNPLSRGPAGITGS